MNMTNIIKTYSEAIALPTFDERFNYLKIGGAIGEVTFGNERYLNQVLYNSHAWRRFRRDMILRDNGMDLACDGCEINGKIILHHINPITIDDIINHDPMIFDPENVICVSLDTHNAIHYGDPGMLQTGFIERKPNDTCPWLW